VLRATYSPQHDCDLLCLLSPLPLPYSLHSLHPHLTRVTAGDEPRMFSAHFLGWDTEYFAKQSFKDPYQVRAWYIFVLRVLGLWLVLTVGYAHVRQLLGLPPSVYFCFPPHSHNIVAHYVFSFVTGPPAGPGCGQEGRRSLCPRRAAQEDQQQLHLPSSRSCCHRRRARW